MAMVIDFVAEVSASEGKKNVQNVHDAASTMFGVPCGNIGRWART